MEWDAHTGFGCGQGAKAHTGIRGGNNAKNLATDDKAVLLVLRRIRDGRVDRVESMIIVHPFDNSAVICINNEITVEFKADSMMRIAEDELVG